MRRSPPRALGAAPALLTVVVLVALLALLALLAPVALAGGAAGSGRLRQRFFLSPSGNISCELDDRARELGTQAYCEAFKPGVSVTLSASGRVRICHGARCLSNPPENATTLRYGRSVRLGPFRCSSRPAAMDCRLRASGRGFAISRSGVTRLR